ncbi:MAG: ribonuclease P protein component [Terriglobales bacterium]
MRWPRARRLLRRPEFIAAYELGMRRVSRHFTLFGRTSATGGVRFGITASRKVGPAVVRNRIRRRTRELLRRMSPPYAGSCEVVINPRPSVADADFQELAQELEAQVSLLFSRLQKE